ncbi:hypothetical protein D3C76_1577030 [compost metagenome]
MAMADTAAIVNQMTPNWPIFTNISAVITGPNELPIFPPTWNIDCESPRLPPLAKNATREDSG